MSSFKRDKFRKNRGDYSRWLALSCEKCKSSLMRYQKDGPGMLKRLYVDRMTDSMAVHGKKELMCRSCKTILGVYIIYKKEQRPAYRLFAGAIEKHLTKAT